MHPSARTLHTPAHLHRDDLGDGQGLRIVGRRRQAHEGAVVGGGLVAVALVQVFNGRQPKQPPATCCVFLLTAM